jgi:hypothetical protein
MDRKRGRAAGSAATAFAIAVRAAADRLAASSGGGAGIVLRASGTGARRSIRGSRCYDCGVERLPPTTPELVEDATRPYFLWWTDATAGDLRVHLRSSDPDERGYWMGALLREANSRDVWLFVRPDDIRRAWASVRRHLGRSRAMWAWLLGIDESQPGDARRSA